MGTLTASERVADALAQGCGAAVEIDEISCLDPQLQGHAFKYAGSDMPFAGVHPYRLGWRVRGQRHADLAMIKAKPSEAAILKVYAGLLAKAGIDPGLNLGELLMGSDYSVPNLKEAVLFRDFADLLAPLLPQSLGVHIDWSLAYALRIEEKLGPSSVILSPDDDTTRAWHSDFFSLVLSGLALLHARCASLTAQLSATGCLFRRDRDALLRGAPLWKALFAFIQRVHPDFDDDLAVHSHLLETLPQWAAQLDQRPHTLLYGDVNPQNLAFAYTENGFRLCLFDWERAILGPAERDVAEHLVYALPSDFDRAQVERAIAGYLAARSASGATAAEPDAFRAGLSLMVRDLLIDRLPLMLVVRHVTGKRPGAAPAYRAAHRLLRMLG